MENARYNWAHAQRCIEILQYSPKRILVVGAGKNGDDVRALNDVTDSAAQIVGLDIREDVGVQYPAANVRYVVEDITNLDVSGYSQDFDLAYSVATFEHVHDVGAGWRNMLSLLRPGGVLFCVSSPLWASPHGHHKRQIFNDHPWVHIKYPTVDELFQFCIDARIDSNDGTNILQHVKYMLNPRFFNKMPGTEYLAIAASLPNCEIQINRLSNAPPDMLARLGEFSGLGYSATDLQSITHHLVARKL